MEERGPLEHMGGNTKRQSQDIEPHEEDGKKQRYLAPSCTQEDLSSIAKVSMLISLLKRIGLQEPDAGAR